MRCEEVQESLGEIETREIPAAVREHLARCSVCDEYARGWRLLRAGFRGVAGEEAPEASLGFAARVMRRFEEATEEMRSSAEFLERVGRRFVYATSCLTLTVLLSLALPSSGPWRGPATPEVYLAQAEMARLGSDPIFTEGPDSRDPAPVRPTEGSGQTER